MELNDKCSHQILCAVRLRGKMKMGVIKAFSLAGKLAPLYLISNNCLAYIKKCKTEIHGERPGGKKNSLIKL